MDVFALRQRLVDDYAEYVGSFLEIADPRIRIEVEARLADGLLWPHPLVQLNPAFEAGETIDQLVDQGVLAPGCRDIFRVQKTEKEGPPEENAWGVRFATMFHMANDSGLFRTREQLEREGWRQEGNLYRHGRDAHLPLYEAKMIHHFDHRFGTYEGQTEAQANQGKLPELDERAHADPTYDALADSIATGAPYRTPLDPPPADPRRCHPPQPRDPGRPVEASG